MSQKGTNGRFLILISPKTLEVINVDDKRCLPQTTIIHRLPFEQVGANLVGLQLYLPLCNLTLAMIDLPKGSMSLRYANN